MFNVQRSWYIESQWALAREPSQSGHHSLRLREQCSFWESRQKVCYPADPLPAETSEVLSLQHLFDGAHNIDKSVGQYIYPWKLTRNPPTHATIILEGRTDLALKVSLTIDRLREGWAHGGDSSLWVRKIPGFSRVVNLRVLYGPDAVSS